MYFIFSSQIVVREMLLNPLTDGPPSHEDTEWTWFSSFVSYFTVLFYSLSGNRRLSSATTAVDLCPWSWPLVPAVTRSSTAPGPANWMHGMNDTRKSASGCQSGIGPSQAPAEVHRHTRSSRRSINHIKLKLPLLIIYLVIPIQRLPSLSRRAVRINPKVSQSLRLFWTRSWTAKAS